MTITSDYRKLRYYKVILLACVLVACSTPEFLSEKELTSYIQDEDNGLSVSRERNGLTVKVNYRPDDFLIFQEVGYESDSSLIKELVDRYSNYIYFVAQLSTGERDALYGTSADQIEFNEKLQTLSFRMNQYVNLTTSHQDTIPVADFYYSRMFGMSGTSDILFVFNEEKIKESEWVSFNMKEFGFKTGALAFRFDTQTINETPKLKELAPYYENIDN